MYQIDLKDYKQERFLKKKSKFVIKIKKSSNKTLFTHNSDYHDVVVATGAPANHSAPVFVSGGASRHNDALTKRISARCDGAARAAISKPSKRARIHDLIDGCLFFRVK